MVHFSVAAMLALVLPDLLIGAWVLFRPARRGKARLEGSRLGVVLLVLVALSITRVLVLRPFGLNGFGVAHLLYLDAAVVLPALGLALLVANGRYPTYAPLRATRAARGLAALPLLGVPLAVYATFIEPTALRVVEASVPLEPARLGDGPLRVGVLTDLQTDDVGAYEAEAVDRLMALAPDLIVLPGDVFQGPAEAFDANLPRLQALFERLAAPGGVYLVAGDVDTVEGLERIVRGTAVTLLENESRTVTVKGRRVTVLGLGLDYGSPAALAALKALEEAPGEGDLRLVVAHRPDAVFGLREGSRVDLVIAGHTHGGQVAVPLFGPPITLTRVPRDAAAGGLHTVGGGRLYVSRGVGHERGQAPRVRFLVPPEVNLLTLE